MTSAATLDAGHTIRVCKKQNRYYAAVDGLAVFGIGDTCEAALADVDRHFGELQSFSEKTGLALDALAPGNSGERHHWRSSLRSAAIVVVCLALLMIPFSYALSSALERTVNDLHLRGGAAFWHGVEESLIRSAGDGSLAPPEDQAKTLAALRVMVQRIEPYANEIKPLFGCARGQ
jgi:hypothetical protein